MRAGLVLAAGRSQRFGKADKLLALLHGKPLLLHAIERAKAAGVCRLYVVTSSARIARSLRGQRGMLPVRARDADAGLSASLAAGLAALRPIEREVLIFLGDMPFAAAPQGMRVRGGSSGARPMWRGEPGHPMLVRTSAARRAGVRGDRGFGALGGIVPVRGRPGNLIDIDSRAALRRARLGSCIVEAR